MLSTAPAAYRQTALRLHDAEPPGHLTSFLLHIPAGSGCATRSVPVSDAGAVLTY